MDQEFQDAVCPNCGHTFKVSVRHDLPSGTMSSATVETTQPDTGTTPTQPEGSVDQENLTPPDTTPQPPPTLT